MSQYVLRGKSKWHKRKLQRSHAKVIVRGIIGLTVHAKLYQRPLNNAKLGKQNFQI
ncbi:uncharacterized protein Dvir_GJ25648 [Drosophila virilis]|uniref:Uncharacterized protein n=1 Tax=Drosophila virilis TaxID=7244 RepID=A0A0Q9WIL0_DROVI|nr:uncharacterized protein Dvir_GJ25648 [Drosophila virilis]